MVLLGIDPGFRFTGFGLLKKDSTKTFLLDYGVLKLPAQETLATRTKIFYEFFQEKILTYKVTHLSLETSFLGKNAQNFLKLGYLRGLLYLLSAQYNLSLHEFTPRQVKLSITGFGGASKEQVARVIGQLFPGIKIQDLKEDTTDALAITLCGLWDQRIQLT